jgi:hypothetical protein
LLAAALGAAMAATTAVAAASEPTPAPAGARSGAAALPVVDVLMLYTPDAAARLGGETELRGIADRAAAYTNEAFTNSRANVRTRVVGLAPAPDYNPDGKNDSDAAYDYLFRAPGSVGAQRGEHRADVVGLFAFDSGAFSNAVEVPVPAESPGQGAMMLLDSEMTRDEPDTYAHELGHLLGLDHDGGEEGTEYAYARGYVAPSMKWRDIMAYEDVCVDAGTKCPVIPYYSNPALTYEGEALGVPKGQPGEADAVSMLNESAPTVAAYR